MGTGITSLATKHFACLGGGIGSVNLIKGLKRHTENISVVVSMADEGGSAGRLRRLYDIHPPGDLVSCMSALIDKEHQQFSELLTYRFPGDRYAKDDQLAGQKLGNLMMVAARDITGSFSDGIAHLKELFHVKGYIYPATREKVTISAVTADGVEVHGEENIDLGKYNGSRTLRQVLLKPDNPQLSEGVIEALERADVIIAGPGDLYTTVLPVLIIPQVKAYLKKSAQKKIFITNVANKPFETTGYVVSDFISAVTTHLGSFPFDTVIVNNRFDIPIPTALSYTYVENVKTTGMKDYAIVQTDLIDEAFSIYHDSDKLATTIANTI
ncbi:MAG TPA: gluconeogenesis factor YvcK family protein [Patescibacteria group bacterium]|nr:gluconeogenesis factor YvcK family protein [Patescibacteria group bacterium]